MILEYQEGTEKIIAFSLLSHSNKPKAWGMQNSSQNKSEAQAEKLEPRIRSTCFKILETG
jgi:hypothetical protein